MSEYTDYLQDVFESFGPIEARRMFGGHGVFHRGLMFALVADGELYLKADAATLKHFEEKNLPPFQYSSRGKPVSLSYYAAPAEMFDDPEQAKVWATRAYQAALRARKPTRKPRR